RFRGRPEASFLETRTTPLKRESRVAELALQHPALQNQLSDNVTTETTTPILSTEGCYTRLLSYIHQSTQGDGYSAVDSDK
ncbi:hypothetical protein H4R20_007086, partial [Coemansia guatemalensis]